MLKRYLARRNDPWELLVIAFMIFIPGLIMLFHQGPMIGLVARTRGGKQLLEVLSPEGAHIVGAIAITFSILIVVLYVWARRAIARDPETHVVEHGHHRM
jgi:ascorbate-specific PTS system EIIC-type component UlaA